MDRFKEIVDMVCLYEEEFAYNHYLGHHDAADSIGCVLGQVPIIISAPHSTMHCKLMEEEIVPVDIYTGGIAKAIQKLTNCYLIFTDKYVSNFNEWYVHYTHMLKEMTTKYRIIGLIDLHGANKNRSFEVEIGTDYGKSISDFLVKEIENIFMRNGISSIYENNPFTASKITTVTNFAYKKLGIDSVQIEINRKLRDPRYDNESFYNLIKSIKEIVEHLGEK